MGTRPAPESRQASDISPDLPVGIVWAVLFSLPGWLLLIAWAVLK